MAWLPVPSNQGSHGMGLGPVLWCSLVFPSLFSSFRSAPQRNGRPDLQVSLAFLLSFSSFPFPPSQQKCQINSAGLPAISLPLPSPSLQSQLPAFLVACYSYPFHITTLRYHYRAACIEPLFVAVLQGLQYIYLICGAKCIQQLCYYRD